MLAIYAGAFVVAASCGRSGSDDRTTAPSRPGALGTTTVAKAVDEQSFFTIGPVLGQFPPPCAASTAGGRVLAEMKNGTTRCFEVGSAVIDSSDVTDATAMAVRPANGGWEVVLSFSPDATARLSALAQKQGVGHQIALVVDGQVASAPAIDNTNISAKAVFTGFDQTGAQDLARRLRHP